MKKYRLSQFINNQRVVKNNSYLLRKPSIEMELRSKLRLESKSNSEMPGPIRRISGWHEYEYNSN